MDMDYRKTGMLNAISIDVEGFVESNLQSFSIPPHYHDSTREDREIERNVEHVLALLQETGTRATFFFVGRIGRDLPGVVRAAADAGHEIGCHNYEHLRLFGADPTEFREKLHAAKACLEAVSGRQVYGFRAPEFSITQSTLWALDVLKELGFLYDSSVYPIGMHDVYGIKDARPFIHTLPNGLVEFPLATVELLGRRFPFGGGGYFRLYPLFLTRRLIARVNRRGHPVMFYIHPYEVGPEIPIIRELSAYRKFRHYYHCRNGDRRLKKILQDFRFGPGADVLREGKFIARSG
jgi:polysaccharide deacetylase family protein (PEP-CTERM system associated)